MPVIHSWDEVPEFADETEEAEFWGTHEIGDELWDTAEEVDWLPLKGPIGARIVIALDEAEKNRLYTLARERGTNPVALALAFVREGITESRR